MEAQTEVKVGQVNAKVRTATGKNINRRLRAAGKIPATIYGEGQSSYMIELDPKELQRALDPEKRRNTVFTLKIEGAEGAITEEKAMLKEFQTDTLKDLLLHVDFIRVTDKTVVKAKVPLHTTGKSEGIQLGGKLSLVFRSLEVECSPENIPTELVVDISSLNLGDSLSVDSLPVPEGVRILLPPEQTIISVVQPKGMDEEEAADEAEGEGSEEEGGEAAVAATASDS